MARYKKGILGSFRGTVGTVVGSVWKGIEYMRSVADVSNSKPSLKQEAQRARFSLVSKFTQPLSPLLNITFASYADKKTGANYVFQYMMKNVLTGIYPNLSLDFSKTIVAKGALSNGGSPSAMQGATGEIKFGWTDNSGNGNANATDKAILVAYCEELGEAVYKLPGANRSDSSDVLSVQRFSGKQAHTWLAFISNEESEIATSIYTGSVDVG